REPGRTPTAPPSRRGPVSFPPARASVATHGEEEEEKKQRRRIANATHPNPKPPAAIRPTSPPEGRTSAAVIGIAIAIGNVTKENPRISPPPLKMEPPSPPADPSGPPGPAAAVTPRVPKTTFAFKSDVRKSAQETCRTGILHALRSSPPAPGSDVHGNSRSGGREEHAFAWIADCDAGGVPGSGLAAARDLLERYGFPRDRCRFVPYSSRANWCYNYPHAAPYVEVDARGAATGAPFWSPRAGHAGEVPPEVVRAASSRRAAAVVAASPHAAAAASDCAAGDAPPAPASLAVGRRASGRAADRLAGTVLANHERNRLHREMRDYFVWLADTVGTLETTEAGRRAVRRADLRVAAIKGLLVRMESTLGLDPATRPGKKGDDDDDDEDVEPIALPLLESSLADEIASRAAVEEEKRKRVRAKKIREEREGANWWEPLDFEEMFGRLLTYRDEHGHPNVPVKYQKDLRLGSWVSGLRTKKKKYDESGGRDDRSEEEKKRTGEHGAQRYLTPERIQRLESIGFLWSMARPKAKPKSWDERLEDLRLWRELKGDFKVPRKEGLGEWLHNQRMLFAKRDAKFLAKKASRMEAIGYVFEFKETANVSWEDRFQQLAEFGRTHGHYDVPCPTSEEEDTGGDAGNSEETAEQYRFHKWVTRLHNEYRAYEKGTPSKLTYDRVQKLLSINFVFKGPKVRGRPSKKDSSHVPKISWERRIKQLESFKEDVGHLRVDHNYKHCSNLGGWAAEMSALHAKWRDGSAELSEGMIDKFRQLEAMGFGFDVTPHYDNNRNWDDHFAVLLRYKEENGGSARVPLKYKADMRLGKWVQTQRNQYKLFREGKESKMAPEKIQKLEEAGFEWDVTHTPRGAREHEEEEMDHGMGMQMQEGMMMGHDYV
ncbi:hypothetical protein ACHAWF_004763, partial [Thalassiosira exigua]